MNKKEIQEQRMKGYFLQATKEILKGEGIKALSVRNIADRAGYSYATLYNYFKGLHDLIAHGIRDFQTECEEYVQKKTKKVKPGDRKIKLIITSYMEYFIQYPGIFDLFYVEKLPSKKLNESLAIFLDKLCAEEWDYCIKEGIYGQEEAEVMQATLRHTTTGLLLFYLNRNTPKKYKDFLSDSEKQLNRVLGK